MLQSLKMTFLVWWLPAPQTIPSQYEEHTTTIKAFDQNVEEKEEETKITFLLFPFPSFSVHQSIQSTHISLFICLQAMSTHGFCFVFNFSTTLHNHVFCSQFQCSFPLHLFNFTFLKFAVFVIFLRHGEVFNQST